MNGDGILRWIYRYALENMFDSNLRAMALVLRVSERTLQKAFDNDNTAESLLVFEQLMEYCMAGICPGHSGYSPVLSPIGVCSGCGPDSTGNTPARRPCREGRPERQEEVL